jgi:hypothetical protein
MRQGYIRWCKVKQRWNTLGMLRKLEGQYFLTALYKRKREMWSQSNCGGRHQFIRFVRDDLGGCRGGFVDLGGGVERRSDLSLAQQHESRWSFPFTFEYHTRPHTLTNEFAEYHEARAFHQLATSVKGRSSLETWTKIQLSRVESWICLVS